MISLSFFIFDHSAFRRKSAALSQVQVRPSGQAIRRGENLAGDGVRASMENVHVACKQ